MIAVVDYGAGNLRSVLNALRELQASFQPTSEPSVLRTADAVVLPGVGSFGDCCMRLELMGLTEALNDQVLVKKKPYLGICVGMQILGLSSEESDGVMGLGWVPGLVRRLRPSGRDFRVPHIGWNDVNIERRGGLYEGFDDEAVFYFAHSYHLVLAHDSESLITGTAKHGGDLVASIQHENIFGVQYHPEKSQEQGLQVIRNFMKVL